MKYLKLAPLVFVIFGLIITHTLYGKYEKIWSLVDLDIKAFHSKMENSKEIESKIGLIKIQLDSLNSIGVSSSKNTVDFKYDEKKFSNWLKNDLKKFDIRLLDYKQLVKQESFFKCRIVVKSNSLKFLEWLDFVDQNKLPIFVNEMGYKVQKNKRSEKSSFTLTVFDSPTKLMGAETKYLPTSKWFNHSPQVNKVNLTKIKAPSGYSLLSIVKNQGVQVKDSSGKIHLIKIGDSFEGYVLKEINSQVAKLYRGGSLWKIGWK
jgi:hypothetical protein